VQAVGRLVTEAALCAVVLSACTEGALPGTGPTANPPSPVARVKIAFLQDLSAADAALRTAPAFQGAKLAFDTVGLSGDLDVDVELVALDTEGDPETATLVARKVAADPDFVGAIGAPFLTAQRVVGAVLDAAGVPTITLSTLGPDFAKAGWTSWRRAVADQARQGAAVAAFVDSLLGATRRGVCLLGDGSQTASGLLRPVAGALRAGIVLRSRVALGNGRTDGVADAVRDAGCGVVIWGGLSGQGALVRGRLVDGGLQRVAFVGADGMKDGTFLFVSGTAGRGTVAACPCADLSTATELAAQRFIQDYQADFGLPPGPYAVEAWDVARMFVQAFRAGALTRAEVLGSLWSVDRFDGLANTYVFEPTGELAPGAARVHLYREQAGRWVAFQEG